MNNLKEIFSLCLMLFFSCSYSSAQEYPTILGAQNTKWKAPFCNLDQTFIRENTTLDNDQMVINGMNYTAVGTTFSGGIDFNLNPATSNGFIRENTTEGKVWFMGVVETMSGLDTIEYLVMDLSLEVGDEFIIHGAFGEEIVSVVDSIYFDSNQKHVQTNYTHWNNNNALTFIEGIGTNYGLAYMHDVFNLCPCLISVDKDWSRVYQNESCEQPIAKIDKETELKPRLYPNPAENQITVENIPRGAKYKIYNLSLIHI